MAVCLGTMQAWIRTFPSDAQGSHLGAGIPRPFVPEHDLRQNRADTSVQSARHTIALRNLPGETLAGKISFFGMMEMPRVQFIAMANNHSIHHRGQLTVYLRMVDVPLPMIYGPTADERWG